MQGIDWGRIAARMTAAIIFTRALDYAFQAAQTYAISKQFDTSGYPELDVIRIVIAISLFLMSIALWVFSAKFAPSSDSEREVEADPEMVVIAIVAGGGTLLFLRYFSHAVFSAISQSSISNFNLKQVLEVHVVYGLLLSLAGVLIVVYARRVSGWLTR